MRTDQLHLSTVGKALFVLSAATGIGLTALLDNRAPLFVGIALGLYLLFAIRVADQWEKVAVLRFGRYVGLRVPACSISFPLSIA